MREIEFRGKRVDENEDEQYWVFGNLEIWSQDEVYISFKCTDDNWSRGRDSEQVIPGTVGQYTGLKDRNGVKIFEGDIVANVLGTGVVAWAGTAAAFMTNHRKKRFPMQSLTAYEVIGNIHDNQELLEMEAQGKDESI
jgi:hypothetical protein